jgi:hypothetical protein
MNELKTTLIVTSITALVLVLVYFFVLRPNNIKEGRELEALEWQKVFIEKEFVAETPVDIIPILTNYVNQDSLINFYKRYWNNYFAKLYKDSVVTLLIEKGVEHTPLDYHSFTAVFDTSNEDFSLNVKYNSDLFLSPNAYFTVNHKLRQTEKIRTIRETEYIEKGDFGIKAGYGISYSNGMNYLVNVSFGYKAINTKYFTLEFEPIYTFNVLDKKGSFGFNNNLKLEF